MTNFGPPPGFDGYENCPFDGDTYYKRACTAEEAELLDANIAAAKAEELAEAVAYEEQTRGAFFGALQAEVDAHLARHPGLEPGPACSSDENGRGEGRQAPDQVRGDVCATVPQCSRTPS
jgi:hypothetical protein